MKPAGSILSAPKVDPQRKLQIAQQAQRSKGNVKLNAAPIRTGGCCGKIK